jgi:hypothetical protein
LYGNQLTDVSGTELAAALDRNREFAAGRQLLDFIARKSTISSVRAVVDAMTHDGLQRAVLKFLLPENIDVGQLLEAYSPIAVTSVEGTSSAIITMHDGNASELIPAESEQLPHVDEAIAHPDEAVAIHPEEAAHITSEQYVSWTLLNSSAVASLDPVTQWHGEFEAVFLHRYSRCPEEFHEALGRGQDLEPVRAALELAGHEWQLPSGAKVFVFPDQFAAVSAVLAGRDLRPHHVVVSQAFEPLVRDALGRLPSRLRVDQLRVDPVALVGGQDAVLCVERTFLDVPRALRAPQSVNQSTTEAHRRYRGGLNPRRRGSP